MSELRKVQLKNSGIVECLYCGSQLTYNSKNSSCCGCGNLRTQGLTLLDGEGAHMYSVIPDYYQKTARRYIIVDIDKTLCLTNEYPFLGKLNEKLVKLLKKLHDEYGMIIIASSCRLNPEIVGGNDEATWHRLQIQDFLDEHKLDFIVLSNKVKPYATLTIDDKTSSYQPLIDLFERMEIFGSELRALLNLR